MIKKLVSLSDAIAERLSQEPNQSAVVDALLSAHYGIPLVSEGIHAQQREDALQDISDQPVVITDPPEEILPGDPSPVEAPEPDLVELTHLDEIAEVPEDPEQVDVLADVEPEPTLAEVLAETREELPEPAVVSVPVAEVVEEAPITGQAPDSEVQINLNGQPATFNPETNAIEPIPAPEPVAEAVTVPATSICPTCGQPKTTNICLNCL